VAITIKIARGRGYFSAPTFPPYRPGSISSSQCINWHLELENETGEPLGREEPWRQGTVLSIRLLNLSPSTNQFGKFVSPENKVSRAKRAINFIDRQLTGREVPESPCDREIAFGTATSPSQWELNWITREKTTDKSGNTSVSS